MRKNTESCVYDNCNVLVLKFTRKCAVSVIKLARSLCTISISYIADTLFLDLILS